MSHHERSSAPPDTGSLLRIAVNYLTSVGQRPDAETIAELRQRLETLSDEKISTLQTRLAVYALLDGQSGRDLRQAAENSSTLIGEQLRQQQRHVRGVLALLVRPDTNPALAVDELAIDTHGQPVLLGNEDPELLYQETLYQGDPQAEAAKLLGKPGADKWIKLVSLAFKDKNIIALLDGLGFVPEQLYATKKFREVVSFQDLAHCHGLLRDHPRGGHARAQLLRHLFLSGIDHQAGGDVTIDTNGLWVNLERRQKGAAHRLHAHIPYPYASLDLLEAMRARGYLEVEDMTEAQLRRAEADNDVKATALFEERQAQQFAESAWRNLNAGMGGAAMREAAILKPNYERLKTLHPPELYDAIIKSPFSQRPSDDPHAPFSYARLAVGVMRHYLRRPLQPGELDATAAGERIGRLLGDAATLQQPATKRHGNGYEIARTAGVILEWEGAAEHVVRVVTNGGKHSYLGLASAPEIRIALNPEKDLTKPQRETFARLPMVEGK